MIYGMILVRNESGRWLETVLQQMKTVCDKIIVLDDCSTDNTPEICRQYAEVFYSDRSYWGINELRQRKFLWELATHEAKDGDFILCLDADETIANIDKLPKLIELIDNDKRIDGISFNLYDMWDSENYRSDSLWNAHERYWVMCVKYDPKREYSWRETALHCGRFPTDACISHYCEPSMKIQHWGWSRPEDRQKKYERYMKADPGGKDGNLQQYLSILDPEPQIRRFEL
jgi:glycosyltransferase involved in cell wall biosynthesis